MKTKNHSIKYSAQMNSDSIQKSFELAIQNLNSKIKAIADRMVCEFTSKSLLVLILLKFMKKEFSKFGINSFDALKFARDSRSLNAQHRLQLFRRVMKMNGEQTAHLLTYLNYIYNTNGSDRAVQDALSDWYLLF